MAPDLVRMRSVLSLLKQAGNNEEACRHLACTAEPLGAMTTAWAPDLSRPYFDEAMDVYHKAQGWPAEVMDLWWSDHATLKMPFYIRCRFEHLPFVTGVSLPLRTSAAAAVSAEQRRITQLVLDMGVRALITTPVHLPRGQVAMVTWAVASAEAKARDIVAAAASELMAAGHYFMNCLLGQARRRGLTPEELSRLTPREWECLRLTAQGYREKEVGDLTGVSGATVRFHLDNARRKLGATTRPHAVALAVQLGIIGPIGA